MAWSSLIESSEAYIVITDIVTVILTVITDIVIPNDLFKEVNHL